MGAGSSRVDASPAPPRRRKRLAFAGCFGVGGPSASAAAAAGGVDGGGNLVASASSSGANEVESQMRERVAMSEDLRASVAAKGLQSSGERDPKVASAHPSSSTISHHLRHSHFGCHENREDALGIENAETNALERSTIKDVMPSGNFHDEVARAERTISQRIASIEPDLVDPLLENADTNTICITEVGGSISEPHLEARDTALDGISSTTTIAFSSERSDISQSSSLSEFPASSVSSPLNGELMPDAFPSGADVPIFRGSQGQSNGSISNDDMVSIFSNGASGQSRATSSSEARRNNRRVMWDVFYRRGSRGHVDSDADDMGFYNRWLDLGDDLFGDEVEETRYFHRRRHGSIRLSQYSRSRIREHRRAVFDSGNEQISAACPLGIHSIGRCTCDSFLVTEGSSARASISRIVMLTEALFEVLDEIHRQPASLSLSVVSIQAPESVVNSLPCKSYKRLDTAQCSDDIEQCHICLTEYEDGDQIRTLPCKHEFHLQCVDKWLKEVHRVCPLCRGDVCEGVS